MKSIQLIVQLALWLGVFLCIALPGYPHGGELDAYGCHHNRKAGSYHCHRGLLAGQSFASQDEILKRISAENTIPTKDNPPPKK